MTERKGKNRNELIAMIMQRIREHPEWDDIVDVVIAGPATAAADQPNWHATFTMHGQLTPPEAAFQILDEFRAKYDLIGNY